MTRPSRRIKRLTPLNVDYQSEAGVDNGADGIDWDTGDFTPILTPFGVPAIDYGTPAAGAALTAIRTDATLEPPDAAEIPFTPAGTISATDVQAAIEEVAAEATGGGGVIVQDEGTPLATTATTLNFVGAGVTATGAGATKTITIPGGGGSGSLAEWFGDGSDGNVTISVDTSLTRPMFYNNLTVNSGITLSTVGYAVYVKGTLTNNGTISRNGTAATNQSGATAPAINSYGSGQNGGAGRANSAGVGTAGTGDTQNAFGGSGGAGGSATNGGGAGGTATLLTSRLGMRVMPDAAYGYSWSTGSQVRYTGGAGGGGGGTAVSTVNTVSGGGGSGGGVTVIAAKDIVNTSGVIQANGGAGAAALITSVGAAGGGGGGGGGVLVLIYDTLAAGTEQAAGGTGGAGVNGGNNGANGSAGKVVKVTPAGITTT